MVTSARVPGCRGRLPADLTRPHLRLTAHLDTAVPPKPVLVDWLSKVDGWPMFANDRLGDCAFAMAGHLLAAWEAYGRGTALDVSLEDLLAAYSAVTGYDPSQQQPDGSNPTDQGTNLQDEFGYWRRTGIGGHKILAYARVDHDNLDEVRAALNVFGGLAVGVNLPAAAEKQFATGNTWDVTADDGGILGGHAIHLGGYDENAGTMTVTTWGHTQRLSENWWRTYVEESWCLISPEWLSVAGLSPEGLDLAALGADFAELTGAPNPFTPPAPPPAPGPDLGELGELWSEFLSFTHRFEAWIQRHLPFS